VLSTRHALIAMHEWCSLCDEGVLVLTNWTWLHCWLISDENTGSTTVIHITEYTTCNSMYLHDECITTVPNLPCFALLAQVPTLLFAPAEPHDTHLCTKSRSYQCFTKLLIVLYCTACILRMCVLADHNRSHGCTGSVPLDMSCNTCCMKCQSFIP
jgi:hypothetical protein